MVYQRPLGARLDELHARRMRIAIRGFRTSLLIASTVFLAFAAYAYLAPALYSTSALVSLVVPADGKVVLPKAAEAARTLQEAALRVDGLPPPRDYRPNAFRVEGRDERTFEVFFSADSATRAQQSCNTLAQVVAEQAPRVLVPAEVPTPDARELERQRRVQEFAAFVAEHPELAADAPAPPPDSEGRKGPDTLLIKLFAERANLEASLAGADESSNDVSDNPYVDPAEATRRADLKRKLGAVNAAIAARRVALDRKADNPAPKVAPELEAEWKRKLRAIAEISAVPAEPVLTRPRVTARIEKEAPLPTSPIKPDRSLWLWVGAAASLIFSSAFLAGQRLTSPRRKRVDEAPDSESPATRRGFRSPSPVPKSPPEPEGSRAQPAVTKSDAPPATDAHQQSASILPPPPPDLLLPARSPSAHALGSPNPPPAPELASPVRRHSSRPPPKPNKDAADARRAVQSIKAEGSAVGEDDDLRRPPPRRRGTQPLGTYVPLAAQRARDRTLTYTTPPPPEPAQSPAGRPARTAAVKTSVGMPPPKLSSRPPWHSRPPADESLAEDKDDPPDGARTNGSGDALGGPKLSPPPPPDSGVVAVCDVPPGWKPDDTLAPAARKDLRDKLFALALEQCLVVVVTGPEGMGERKSRVAAEIALALAEAGHPRILLMDTNFHRPRVHRLMQLDIPVAWGFSQQLHTRVHGEIVQGWAVLGCTSSLHVLGESVIRSPGMLLSKQFEDCMRELRTYYDIIVVDAPDPSFDLDCRALDVLADGMLMVVPPNAPNAMKAVLASYSAKLIDAVTVEPLP